ncbi:serine O-acetyltransferase EpsC [Leptolyngbya sp. KIOST-1]|uniref:serine O-acetyltransferase EpsC n=1 Tax=Leptolyngbya sp. KIOST-1 TaxID=1229172 RepID=UPI0009DC9CD7|nr:serine O-acetyltransferase EpsC [Leptolyngbya sp. KIOST-1]
MANSPESYRPAPDCGLASDRSPVSSNSHSPGRCWPAPDDPRVTPPERSRAALFAPGWLALGLHRVAHTLHQRQVPLVPRLLSHLGRFVTGTEIHPGAQIGAGVVIRHGYGVVIGETAIVGQGSVIHQEVTLGGTGKERGKRHPTLGQGVVVGPGAKVLGNIHIGDYARIGAGAIVLRSAPRAAAVVGVPGRNLGPIVSASPTPADWQPDLEAQVLRSLFVRLQSLEAQLATLRTADPATTLPLAQSNDLIEAFFDGAGI